MVEVRGINANIVLPTLHRPDPERLAQELETLAKRIRDGYFVDLEKVMVIFVDQQGLISPYCFGAGTRRDSILGTLQVLSHNTVVSDCWEGK